MIVERYQISGANPFFRAVPVAKLIEAISSTSFVFQCVFQATPEHLRSAERRVPSARLSD